MIVVMVDGVGLAAPGPTNPVAAGFAGLRRALGIQLAASLDGADSALLARPIDACLGVPGLPQSGSGHSTIYGGYNAAAANGRHQPSYPTVAMRERLAADNLLLSAQRAGHAVAWANAYLPGYADAVASRRMRHTAGTWCALAAGLSLRGVPDLLRGTSVAWDIDQRLAQARLGSSELPVVAPEAAGARLSYLAREHALVAYETYLPDLAGHNRLPLAVPEALALVDGLLVGALETLSADTTLVVTSDHGNSEDLGTRVHTRNPVPLLVVGPAAPMFARVQSLDMLAPAILAALDGGA